MIIITFVLAKSLSCALDSYCLLASQGQQGLFQNPWVLQSGIIIDAAWIVFALYWLVASFSVKRAQKREPLGARLVHVLFMMAGFILFYSSDPRFGPLNHRLIHALPWVTSLGTALTVAGIAFAIWARYHIGQYWSGSVTLREGHKLIRTGPYAHIRHPIYTGLLVALAGTVLVVGRYRALVALAMFLIGFVIKAKKEEALLTREFGPAFEEHKRLTGFFLPRFS